MGLIITCPQCKKESVHMPHFFAEYLCKKCAEKETMSLKQRRQEAHIYEMEKRKNENK